MKLEFGDILLFKGTGIVSKIIEKVSNSQYSHAAICLDDWHMAEAMPSGIEINHIRDLPTGYDVYRYPLTNEQKTKMKEFIYGKISTPYNYEELFAALFEEELNIKIPYDKNKLICSQFVWMSFLYLGIDLLPSKTSDIVKPSDLAKSKLLVKVN